jgi:hypothetical protein
MRLNIRVILNQRCSGPSIARFLFLAALAAFLKISSFCLTPLLSCCTFHLPLACFYLPGQRFIVSLQDFKPVTYWQTASNCLQSRQGSQTIQLVPPDLEGSTRNFGENAWPILATPEVRPAASFQNGGLGRDFPKMELLVHCYQGFINTFY